MVVADLKFILKGFSNLLKLWWLKNLLKLFDKSQYGLLNIFVNTLLTIKLQIK